MFRLLCVITALLLQTLRGPRRFLYEELWQRDDSYEAAMLDGWEKAKGFVCLLDLNNSIIHMQAHRTDWEVKGLKILEGSSRRPGRSLRGRNQFTIPELFYQGEGASSATESAPPQRGNHG